MASFLSQQDVKAKQGQQPRAYGEGIAQQVGSSGGAQQAVRGAKKMWWW